MAILVGTSGFDYKDWRGPFYPRFTRAHGVRHATTYPARGTLSDLLTK